MSNYEFAFNNPKYADRKIRFVIQEEEEEKNSEEEEAEEEEEEEEGDEEEEEDLKPQSLERALKRRRCNSCDKSLSAQVEREEIHVNRIILGKESLYFRRIFDGDCFKECSEKVIEIALNPEEKESFVDLIKYMYTNKLEAHTVEELLHVWDLSQRFLVESCGTLCLQRMISLPLSLESSCYFLDSAAVVNQTEEFKALVAKSIAFLANHFRVSLVMNGEISSRWENSEDLAKLSSNVLETLLTTDDLQVVYEDSVYYAVRTWIRANCKGTQDEKEAWDRFGPLIRWPMIEMFRIKALLGKMECNALHGLLLEALLYHASTDEEKEAMEMTNMSNNNRFRRRGRHAMPVKFISVTSPV